RCLSCRHRLARRLCRDRRCQRCRVHRQCRCCTRQSPRRVAHHHIEGRAAICDRRHRRRITRRCRSGDVRPVLLPLVVERRCPCRYYRERRCLSCRHRLARRLCRDRRCQRCRVHRQCRCCTRQSPRRVAHHHIAGRAAVCDRHHRRRITRRCRSGDVRPVLLPLVT